MTTVMWSRLEGHGLEYCEIDTRPVTRLSGNVVAELDRHLMSVSYTVQCRDDGTTDNVHVFCRMDGIVHELALQRTAAGRWFCNSQEVRECFGLEDIDLGITPSTNTLPIRRFNLSPGESKELTAVWLRFPELSVMPLAQRYTCIDSNRYLYESIKSGYQAIIHVDSGGIVMEYEGEWLRV